MREDLRKIIEDNWEDIQALIIEKAEAEQKPKSVWDLKVRDGEMYSYIGSSGGIEKSFFDSIHDENARDIGNVFLTKEEAEFEVERRKIEAIMKKYGRPFKHGEGNWHIAYDGRCDNIDFRKNYYAYDGVPYFESIEITQKVIDEIGKDRLKKYWFGVE